MGKRRLVLCLLINKTASELFARARDGEDIRVTNTNWHAYFIVARVQEIIIIFLL